MSNVCQSGSKGKDPRCVFPTCLCLHCLCFLWVSWSGFGSSFLPKEESVTAAPEVEVIDEYQSSSQVCLCLSSKSHSLPLKKPWIPGGPTVTGECGVNKMIATVCKFKGNLQSGFKDEDQVYDHCSQGLSSKQLWVCYILVFERSSYAIYLL